MAFMHQRDRGADRTARSGCDRRYHDGAPCRRNGASDLDTAVPRLRLALGNWADDAVVPVDAAVSSNAIRRLEPGDRRRDRRACAHCSQANKGTSLGKGCWETKELTLSPKRRVDACFNPPQTPIASALA